MVDIEDIMYTPDLEGRLDLSDGSDAKDEEEANDGLIDDFYGDDEKEDAPDPRTRCSIMCEFSSADKPGCVVEVHGVLQSLSFGAKGWCLAMSVLDREPVLALVTATAEFGAADSVNVYSDGIRLVVMKKNVDFSADLSSLGYSLTVASDGGTST